MGGVECLQVAYWFGNISLFCGGRCLDPSVIPPFCFVCSLPLGDFVRFADVRLVMGLVAIFLGAHPLGGAPDFSLVLPVVFTAKHNLAALHTQNSIIYKIVIRSSFGSNNYFLKQYVCRL